MLCRAFLIPWKGNVHVIGLPMHVQLRPVPLPEAKLSYWRQTVAWEQATAPNFPNLGKPTESGPTLVCHVIICHLSASRTKEIFNTWKSADPDSSVLIAYGGSRTEFESLDPEINSIYVSEESLRTKDHVRERQEYRGVLSGAARWLSENGSAATHIHLAEFDVVPVTNRIGAKLVNALTAESADLAGFGLVEITHTIHPHNRREIADASFLDFLKSVSKRESPDRIFTMLGCSSIWNRSCFDEIASLDYPRVYLEIGNVSLAHHLGYRVRPMPGSQQRFVSFHGDHTCSLEKFRNEGAWLVHPCKSYWDACMENSPVAKPKLLLCGHTYGVAVNRAKATALGKWFDVMVCSPDFKGIEVMGQDGSTQEWEIPGSTYEYRRLMRWSRNSSFTRSIAHGLRKQFKEWKPDVVLCEAEPWAVLRWQTRLISVLMKDRPIFAEFTWENIPRKGLKGFVLSQVYRLAGLTTHGVVCGNLGAESLMRRAGVDSSRLLRTGQLGVDPLEHPMASPEEKQAWKQGLDLPPDAFIVGFCGRFVEEKGILDLIQAMDALKAQDMNIALVFLGTGPLAKDLVKLASERQWFRLLPPVSHAEVPGIINRFDLFVLPSKPQLDPAKGSLWEEQFGHVLIEAMMAGTPCIGSNSGGIPEVLETEDVIFRAGDVPAMSAHIASLASDPQKLTDLARRQYNRTLEFWNHDALAGRYATFLLGLLAKKRRTSPRRR